MLGRAVAMSSSPRTPRTLRISYATVFGAAALVAGCADDETPCSHRACDIHKSSCAEFVAEVIACQRDVPVTLPDVRFATAAELVAERDPPTQEELDHDRDYWAGEALVGLMPTNYDPADEAADSLSGVLAQYRPATEEIIIVSDSNIDDEETAYRVLVHEMIHAQQDAEYDLDALWDEYATTFPRGLGLRAAVEGEASLFTTFAELELADLTEDEINWERYFADWQTDMLERARDSEVPSLDVRGLFPYSFGSEQVYRAWTAGGLEAVRDYVQHPPDSVRQVMAGYAHRPPEVFNQDTALAPMAVPVLPGHTYLGGAGQDSWLLNTMLQRTAGISELWRADVAKIEADHLSVWRDDASGARVAVWRLVGDTSAIHTMLTGPGSRWIESPQDARTHHIRRLGADWILVAAENVTTASIADSITGWQSQAEAFESAGLSRAPRRRQLVLPDTQARPASNRRR